MYDPTAMAKSYRRRAAEFRAKADSAAVPATRAVYLGLVRTFDSLAGSAEEFVEDLRLERLALAMVIENRFPPPTTFVGVGGSSYVP